MLKEQHKLDRLRIQKDIEGQLMVSMCDEHFTVKILYSSNSVELSNLQNISDILDIKQDLDKRKKVANLINLESAEYYRFVIVYHQGNPIASGCINITRAPILDK